MKQFKDKPPHLMKQEEKEKVLKDLLNHFEDVCYVMLSAIKSYRKTFGISKGEDI